MVQLQHPPQDVELGILVGNDVLRYHDELGADPLKVNPFDVLFGVPDPEFFRDNVRSYLNYLENGMPVMLRVSDCSSGNSTHLVTNSLRYLPGGLRKHVTELERKVSATMVEESYVWDLVQKSWFLTDPCVKGKDVLIESYNDAAAPTPSSLATDFSLIVAPGRIFLYKGEDFRKVVEFLGSPWSVSSSEAFKYLKALRSFHVEPLSPDSLGAVADFIANSHEG